MARGGEKCTKVYRFELGIAGLRVAATVPVRRFGGGGNKEIGLILLYKTNSYLGLLFVRSDNSIFPLGTAVVEDPCPMSCVRPETRGYLRTRDSSPPGIVIENDVCDEDVKPGTEGIRAINTNAYRRRWPPPERGGSESG